MAFYLIELVDKFFLCYMVMLFVRILGSWFPEYQDHQVMRFIRYYTNPYLNFFRRFIPPLGMMSFSPIVAFFCLSIIEQIVKQLVIMIFACVHFLIL